MRIVIKVGTSLIAPGGQIDINLLRGIVDQAAERAGFAPRVSFQVSSHDRTLALVGEGLGVALVPASAVRHPPPPGVAVLPLSPAIDRTVGAGWRADRRHTPAASAFLALLRERTSPADLPASPAVSDG